MIEDPANRQLDRMVRTAAMTAALLLVPLVAMRFTEEVDWDLLDFLVAGGLVVSAGLVYELISSKLCGVAPRAAVAAAIGAAVLLVWATMAVGFPI